MVDQPGAIWMPNNNFFKNTGKKSFIILHGTAGGSSAQGIAEFFKRTEGTTGPASTHYIIGKDGIVVQTVLEKDGAYGNGFVSNDNWGGNPNHYTISIEHVKNNVDANGRPDNSDELTEAQKQASFRLVKDICERHGIGKHDATDETGITGHFSIDPANRSRCPGPYPWQELFAYLAGNQQPQEEEELMIELNTPGVSIFFEGSNNTIWKCKANGKLVGHAVLDFYRKLGNSGLCGLTYLGLPKSNERSVPGYPGVVEQDFERGLARYDPKRLIDNPPGATGPVYLAHIDQFVTQFSQLQAVNADLKEQNDTFQKLLNDDEQAKVIAAQKAQMERAIDVLME